MAKTPKSEGEISQKERFIEAARAAGTDDNEQRFEQRLRAVAGANSDHRSISKKQIHDSDCSTHNGPALAAGPCDCSLSKAPR